MKLIGISEEEVLGFTDARADVVIDGESVPVSSDYVKSYPDKESLDANLDYARQLDSLVNGNR